MKSDNTKRADDLKEFLAMAYEKKARMDQAIGLLIEADVAQHAVLDKEDLPPVDREISVILHNMVAIELSGLVTIAETFQMSIEGLNHIYKEQLALAKGETI